MTARALVTTGDGALRLETRQRSQPDPGGLVVAPRMVGLCGTDLELIDGAVDPAFVRYPLVIGHEWTGVVMASRSPAFSPGHRVVVEGIVPCGSCAPCKAGATNICEIYAELGFTFDGAAADEVAVRSDLAHRISADVTDEDAVLVEPLAVVYQGLSRIVERPGMDCLVVGDGSIGLLAAKLLTLWSPARVVVAGKRSAQGELAKALGADAFVDDVPARAFDLVVEAAGTPEAVVAAVSAARRGGAVLLLGLPPHGMPAPLPVDDLVNGDLVLRASFAYTSMAWRQVVGLLNAGRMRAGALVTHRYGLDAFDEAITTLRTPPIGSPRGKVVLKLACDSSAGGG